MRLYTVTLIDPPMPNGRKLQSKFLVMAENKAAAIENLQNERPSEFIFGPDITAEEVKGTVFTVLLSRKGEQS